ncbi:N-acetyl-gamma-glutamyl-phosphate reductase [Pseudohoeflea coraliihabitans]|uniref:N-acetyl-gamma-glutamyl-phosphate reductase n=1 Tax=Pseudohoeflea coraliihabitans TaxID=2860393 RepID=A0ABS6WS54_9HYPH|nr:N-acetyl-gamma-glutamyl-phosphate reductase [Pseudohoeflea sp. DP4N28-3]MBW3098796.1 N-acetyl-gamma-glutamyl-phosphate reductase [Pseudohoeflea sp. DP4N28-3]
MAQKIYIDGEHGTTGLQILNRLADRKDIELLSIPADKRKDPDTRADFLRAADIAILCLPDDAAREAVALGRDAGTRFIDASTAHRTAEGWVYGFAEMAADQAGKIAEAQFVANPGCWPQGPIAGLKPLIASGLLPADLSISISGISGYSGGGKQMIADYQAMGDDAPAFMPYALGLQHKHVPEIRTYCGLSQAPIMQPAVGNFAQGMLTMVPLHLAHLDKVPSGSELHAALAEHYGSLTHSAIDVAPFDGKERSSDLNPQRHNDTNRMTLHVCANDARGQALLLAVYDNLGKGASGAAVQNLDLMIGRSG